MKNIKDLEKALLTKFAKSNGTPCTLTMKGSQDVLTLVPHDIFRYRSMSEEQIMHEPLKSFFPIAVTYENVVLECNTKYRFFEFITNYDDFMHNIKCILLPYFNRYIKGHTTREIEKPTNFAKNFDSFNYMYKSFFDIEYPMYDGTFEKMIVRL